MRKAWLLFAGLAAAILAAQDRFGPGKVLYTRESSILSDEKARKAVDAAFAAAAEAGDPIGLRFSASRDTFEIPVNVIISISGAYCSASLSIEDPKRGHFSEAVTGADEAALLKKLPTVLVGLAAKCLGKTALVDPPVPVAELEFAELLPGYGLSSASVPNDVGRTADGRIFVPFQKEYLVLDASLRVLDVVTPPRFPPDETINRMAITSSGIMYVGTVSFRSIFRYTPDAREPFVFSPRASYFYKLQAFPDGALAIDDQSIQVKKFKDGLPALFGNSPTLPGGSAFTVDHEGILWTYDLIGQCIQAYTQDGRTIASFKLIMPAGTTISPNSITCLGGGSIVVSDLYQLASFNRYGLLRWYLKDVRGPLGSETPYMVNYLYADPGTGDISIVDGKQRRLLKLVDTDILMQNSGSATLDTPVLKAAKSLMAKSPGPSEAIAYAKMVADADSPEAGLSLLYRASRLFPSSADAKAEYTRVKRVFLLSAIAKMEKETLSIAQRSGADAAQQKYLGTLLAHDSFIFSYPDDSSAKQAKKNFEDAYRKLTDPSRQLIPAPKILNVKAENLVPAYGARYLSLPPVTFSLQNTTGKTLKGMRAEVFIRGFMDTASGLDINKDFPAGGSMEIGLPLRLSQAALALEEDIPVQAEITVSYDFEGQRGSAISTAPLTIYRRTALSWKDTRSLAAFITPNDSLVGGFAAAALAGAEAASPLGKPFARACRVLEAMGAAGIAYVPDPGAGVQAALGKAELMDTVRFPRTTLDYRIGDCDDMTALAASLLESAGLPTAILTGPGHVYMAFSPEPDSSQAWMFAGRGMGTIIHEGRLWIPVETTVLKDGFMAAWQKAWELWSRTEGQREIVSLASSRAEYPAVPLPMSSLVLERPLRSEVDRRAAAAAQGVDKAVLAVVRAALQEAASGKDKAQAVKALNRLAILGIKAERWAEAEASLRQALDRDPASVQSVANLAALKMNAGKEEEAGSILRDALRLKPESTVLNRLYGEYLERTGRSKEAGPYLTKGGAAPASPGQTQTQRASEGGGPALPLFSEPLD
jgi:hypothetical protein